MTESEKVIIELKDLKAFLMPPAEQEELDGVLWDEIPDDYKEFLSLANGAQASGLLLLGTEIQTLAGGQIESDIIATTMNARSSELFGQKNLALGHLTGNLLLIHDGLENRYKVIDKSNYEAVFEFNSLYEVVSDWSERKRTILKKAEDRGWGTSQ